VAQRAAGGLGRPAAVYDSVTEGLTGWQFLRTWRWIGFITLAIIFALLCAGLATWQFDRGRGASADNRLWSDNFAQDTVPLTQALPTLDAYRPGQVWRAVSMHGTWDAQKQFYLRNSILSGNTGFEVITPLHVSTGGTFLVDRGWIASSNSDPNLPASRPRPASGPVDVVARLQPSQPEKGNGGVVNGQIESIDLSELVPVVGPGTYTKAWGVLVSPSSSAQGLSRLQATPPAEGVGYHYSYMIQWILFALIGFFLLGRGASREYRRINADDPDVQRKELERVRRQARKGFTDEDTEDEALDGYVPLTRWGATTGPATAVTTGPARPALTGTPIPFDATADDADRDAEPDHTAEEPETTPESQAGQVYVLDPEPVRAEPVRAEPIRLHKTDGPPDQPRSPSNGST
jgi:cytochrome oxidase assembly protein ShyY1